MPSRHEPCGLGQLIAMRYGSVPVVRATGGLADTVSDVDPSNDTGVGFVFHRYDPIDFFGAVARALEVYRFPEAWRRIVRRGMARDSSWDASAAALRAPLRRSPHRPPQRSVTSPRHRVLTEQQRRQTSRIPG